jgi:regulator of cell morphogenesis and NO signaling
MATDSSGVSLIHQSLADIVTADVRTAAVFDRLGLDYCCHGHHSLEEAAAARGLPIPQVLTDIAALGPVRPQDHLAGEWTDLAALTSHIVSRHHGYVRQASPVISGWLDKLVSRHGQRHPELERVQSAFRELAGDMAVHMVKEENILFPFVDALAAASRTGGRLPAGPFGTVLNPIRMMEEDHRHAGDELARIRELTDNYTQPPDACTTYRLCYEELAKYEADLHRHVHLENNVLFPRAVELEHGLA